MADALMPHRYEQVLLTYARQWQIWAYVAFAAAVVVLVDVLPQWVLRPMQFVFIAVAASWPAAVIGHAKQQFADARAALTPGFRVPHLVVAVALSLGWVVAVPLLAHRAMGAPALGLIAAVALVACPFAVIAYFQTWAGVLLACAATGLLVINQIREAGEAMLTGHADGIALAALAAASCVFAFLFTRLAGLREGMLEYGHILGDRREYTWAATRSALPGQRSLWTRIQLAMSDHQLRRIDNVAGSGPWRRVRHWMLSGETTVAKWLVAACIALMVTAMPIVAGDDEPGEGVAIIAFIISVIIPAFCVAGTWMPRRRSMGYESTRPMPREQFVREFGLAMGADLAGWWAWLTLAAAVPLLVWAPSVSMSIALPLVALAAAEQVLAFGIVTQLLRWHSHAASEGSVLFSIAAVVMPLLIAIHIPPKTAGVTLAIAAGVALLGAALTYDAYRRWCEADLA